MEPWEAFMHQSAEPMVNKNLDPELIKEFTNLNETVNGKYV